MTPTGIEAATFRLVEPHSINVGVNFSGIKHPRSEVDNSSPSGVEVKN
jgi:hypothetical protein